MRKTLARLLTAAAVLALAFGCAPVQEETHNGLKLWFPTDPALGKLSFALEIGRAHV